MLVQAGSNRLERAGAHGRLGDTFGQQLAQRFLTRHQELALVGEVPEEGALGDAGALGDLRNRGGVVILLGETAALTTLGQALIGTDNPLITVSGTPWVPGRVSTETDPLPTDGIVGGRSRTVNAVLELASQGVRSACIRLPRTVHNEGNGGFAGLLTDFARRTRVSGCPGDGSQRWPAVHALDAAVLFRLALEQAPAGSAWHAVDDEGDAVRDIAAVIGRRLGVPTESVPESNFGPMGPIFAMDQPSSGAHTRETLGWTPTHPRLLADLENIRTAA